jgi:two-component system, OmpR family, response regulator CpxR
MKENPMSVITLFSGTFCGADEIARRLAGETGYALVSDERIVERACALSGIAAERIQRCFTSGASVFNPFTRERERIISWLRLALAEFCQDTGWVLHGFTSHLIPASIGHALHACLIADLSHRVRALTAGKRIGRTDAAQRIKQEDRQRAVWVRELKGKNDPWDASLYDIVVPTHTLDVTQAVVLIRKALASEAVQPTQRSKQAAADFMRAARIESTLAQMGHAVGVQTEGDAVCLRIDRPVLMLNRLEEELRQAVRSAGHAGRVTITVEPANGQSDVYRRYSDALPSKVLLVDDEREFVQTLSERLGMRDIGSAVAFDGESALELINEDEPEVMLLDLQMPGINGIEVLKQVKSSHPDIEVVILTGHGTEEHRALCLQLGAFAYLEKPVDIELLSETLKRANARMRQNRLQGINNKD